MHVLIIPSFYPEASNPINGIFFQNQAEALADVIDQVGVVYVEQKSLKRIFSRTFSNRYQFSSVFKKGVVNYTIHGINLLNQYSIGTRIWRFLSFLLAEKYMRENGIPDVIHAHNIFQSGFVAYRLSIKYNIPYVITEHSSGFLMEEYTRRQINESYLIVKTAKCVISVGKKLAMTLKKTYDRDFFVIPNIVNTSFFIPNKTKADSITFQFISVGNLLANKGHAFLIDSFAKVLEKTENIRLVICGEGPERRNLELLIKRLSLENRIFLKGKLEREQLLKEYQESDCLVLPSENETFGVVLIEALACGLPVIATKSGGPEDIVNEKNGILVNYNNVEELVNAMNRIVSNYDKIDHKGIREDVIVKYSNHNIINMLVDVYGK